MKVFRKVNTGRNPDIEIHEALTVRRASTSPRSSAGWRLERAGADATSRSRPRDAPAVPAHRQRRLGPGAGQRARPVRRGGPARRRGRRRLRRRGGAPRRGHRRGARRPRRGVPDRVLGRRDLAVLADAMLARLEVALASCPSSAATRTRCRRPSAASRPSAPPAERRRPARARRLPPRPDAAHRQGLEDRGLRGRAGQGLAERVRPDPVWRDVAGMLRSFDYAAARRRGRRAGRGRRRVPQIAFRAQEWADRNHRGLPDGYVENSGRTTEGASPPSRTSDPAGLHRGQGGLRGGLRGPQPAVLAAHPAGRDRPDHPAVRSDPTSRRRTTHEQGDTPSRWTAPSSTRSWTAPRRTRTSVLGAHVHAAGRSRSAPPAAGGVRRRGARRQP